MATQTENRDSNLALIGQRFKQFRKEKGITQEDLKEVGNAVVMSRIENGHRFPNPEILIYMAKKYSMDINWLLTGTTIKKSTSDNSEILARLGLAEARLSELEKAAGIKSLS
ncbi:MULTISPECIES: helix-turn-helix domain-containing protein [Sphingobacterium]|uniref:helix-turn-helix domain-containing protein n=1 Tax=Sphingobacterium TaxID=28453 RepID=UPI002580E142|nr:MULTISPECIES: helix-turn-helix transcriptional regulator [Sphingobacterium]